MIYGVSEAERVDVEEGEGFLAFEEFHGGDFTCEGVRGGI